MNILIVAPFVPYPLDQGGKIRVFNLIKALSRRHEVTLACLASEKLPDLHALDGLCKEVIVVENQVTVPVTFLRFLALGRPFNCERFFSSELRGRLKQAIASQRFDLVQIEFSLLWSYADLFTGIPVVLDAHNIEHHNVGQIGKRCGNPLKRLLYRIEEARLKSLEERSWRESAACITVSEKEELEIRQRTGKGNVVTAPNGVDPERFAFAERKPGGKRILFLGGMDYFPNLDAASFFLQEVLPLIRAEEPGATVLMVGRELDRLGALLPAPGVEYHESVPEVLPWFYQADLLVVPLRVGAGTRVKILEAMAAGLPVVATTKGCEGIAAQNGEHLVVADSAADLANGAVQLLKQPEQGRRLAGNSRRLVLERYTWERAADIIDHEYERLTKHE